MNADLFARLRKRLFGPSAIKIAALSEQEEARYTAEMVEIFTACEKAQGPAPS